jgi:hypothetical protein
MIPVSSIIYTAASQPPMLSDVSGICCLCGIDSVGQRYDEWVKQTFTDHTYARAGTIICQACQFCASDRCPGLAERQRKDKPQRFRNYSHIVVAGIWYPLSKGEKPKMRELLINPVDAAIIAVSGQKHLFYRAVPGWWQVEEIPMRAQPTELDLLLRAIIPMLDVFSKAEILSGRYDQRRIMMFGLPRWRMCEHAIAPQRGSALLDLAVFLAQKDEDDDT